MKIVCVLFFGLFLALPQALADGPIGGPIAIVPDPCKIGPSYDACAAKKHIVPKKTPPILVPTYVVTLYQGSLKHNLIRIAHGYGWDTVVWNAPEDYLWIGTTTVSGRSLEQILSRVLIKYPVQAQFYQGNRVLAIVPRNVP